MERVAGITLGVEPIRDILALIDFAAVVKLPPRLMDARIFPKKQIELRRDRLSIPVKKRLIHDPQQNLFFIKLVGLT